MPKVLPKRRVNGSVNKLLIASDDGFVSSPTDSLVMRYSGIDGDYHEGMTRKSGGREPWYDRGTEMRNERQISLVCQDELDQVAKSLRIERLEPGWIGANLVIDGVKDFSLLPPRTVLKFEGGVSIRIDGYNGPCKIAGASIAAHIHQTLPNPDPDFDPDASQLALDFVKAAYLKRGLVGWVEREGTLRSGEAFTGYLYEQWLYEG